MTTREHLSTPQTWRLLVAAPKYIIRKSTAGQEIQNYWRGVYQIDNDKGFITVDIIGSSLAEVTRVLKQDYTDIDVVQVLKVF